MFIRQSLTTPEGVCFWKFCWNQNLFISLQSLTKDRKSFCRTEAVFFGPSWSPLRRGTLTALTLRIIESKELGGSRSANCHVLASHGFTYIGCPLQRWLQLSYSRATAQPNQIGSYDDMIYVICQFYSSQVYTQYIDIYIYIIYNYIYQYIIIYIYRYWWQVRQNP